MSKKTHGRMAVEFRDLFLHYKSIGVVKKFPEFQRIVAGKIKAEGLFNEKKTNIVELKMPSLGFFK